MRCEDSYPGTCWQNDVISIGTPMHACYLCTPSLTFGKRGCENDHQRIVCTFLDAHILLLFEMWMCDWTYFLAQLNIAVTWCLWFYNEIGQWFEPSRFSKCLPFLVPVGLSCRWRWMRYVLLLFVFLTWNSVERCCICCLKSVNVEG